MHTNCNFLRAVVYFVCKIEPNKPRDHVQHLQKNYKTQVDSILHIIRRFILLIRQRFVRFLILMRKRMCTQGSKGIFEKSWWMCWTHYFVGIVRISNFRNFLLIMHSFKKKNSINQEAAVFTYIFLYNKAMDIFYLM